MAQKSIGYVQMVWTCPNCGAKNPGARRTCKNCGASMPKDVKFEVPIKEELIQDQKIVEEAKAGPDIYCAYCGNRNPGNAATCSNCGAALSEGKTREAGEKFAAQETPATDTIRCEVCGTENPINLLACTSCGSPLKTSYVPPSSKIPEVSSGQNGRKGFLGSRGCLITGIMLLILGFIAIYFAFLKTDQTTAVVTNTEWKTQIEILGLVNKTAEDWYDEIPSNSTIEDCSKEVREKSDSYVPGSVEECGEPYLVDRGNGYSEKVQDCFYNVYDDKCTYTYLDWGVISVKTATGQDSNPRMPLLNLGSDQKKGSEQVSYTVSFQDDAGKNYAYNPTTIDEYQTFNLDDTYTIEVNGMENIISLEKK